MGVDIKITKVVWGNYRRLVDGAIDVRGHVILVGPISSGKSSVLRLIAMCLGSGSELGSITIRDFTDVSQPLVAEVVLGDLDDDDRAAFPDEIDVSDGDTVTVRVKATVDPADPDATLTVARTFPVGGHTRRPSTSQLQRFGFAFVPAGRSLGRELAGAQGVARRLLSGLDMTTDGPALAGAEQALRDALASSATVGDFRARLAAGLSDALPRRVTKEDVQLVMSSDLLESPLAGTTLTLNDGGTSAPLQDQSEGVQALSVLALMAMQTAESRIVAIDEPETYLHPTAQRMLVAALLQGPSQRLLATHSSSVASAANPQHIVAFGADGRVRQLPPDAPIGAPLRLLRDWRQALVEPLTARLIVFVEGASDRILVEGIARLLGHNLDQRDVAVFQLDGSGGFGAAWGFFGAAGLDLPVRGICDDDAKDDWAGAMGIASGVLSSHGFLVLQPDLEGYYVSELGHARILELLRGAGLVSDRQLLGATGKTDPAQLTPDELAAACRRARNKTAAAVSIAIGMTVADATALTMLAGFVGSLAA